MYIDVIIDETNKKWIWDLVKAVQARDVVCEKSLFHTLTVVIDRAEAVNTLHPCHIFISLTSVMGKEKCQLHALSPCHLVSTLQP